jgi:hypothetical protein
MGCTKYDMGWIERSAMRCAELSAGEPPAGGGRVDQSWIVYRVLPDYRRRCRCRGRSVRTLCAPHLPHVRLPRDGDLVEVLGATDGKRMLDDRVVARERRSEHGAKPGPSRLSSDHFDKPKSMAHVIRNMSRGIECSHICATKC